MARSRAAEVAMLLGDGPAGSPLAVVDPEHDAVQVVRDDGTVAAASPNLAGRPAMVWPVPPEPVQVVGPQDAEALLVVAQPAGPDRTVLVARTVQARDDSVLFVATLLAVGLPVLRPRRRAPLLAVVGRALRPVEAIRREVDAISSSALHRRVSEPPGADEISRLATTMNRMLDRLDRAQQQQRRFVSDASHELRSPIAAIRQHAEVAEASGPHSVPELARTVLDEDLRMQYLVEDLLLLARTDEHGRPLAARSTSTTWCSTRPASCAAPRGAGRHLGGVRRPDYGDEDGAAPRPAQPRRERAPGTPARRSPSPCREADGVELVVDDDGPGIPPQERDRVLQRFVRLDEARNRDDGGAASVWPSSPRWSPPTAAACPSRTARTAGRGSACPSRGPRPAPRGAGISSRPGQPRARPALIKPR